MIEVKGLKKTYTPKKGQPVRALDGVSLKFPETGLVFILGKSGSGKSTLLHIMGGLDTADEGEIIIRGRSSEHFSQSDFDSYRNTYLGFIFQEYNVLDEFTVAANIGLALELQGQKATDERVNAILKEVDLEGLGARKPNELSGGQKQRVAIARALIKDPQIIMADEPTGALDSKTGEQVFDTLKKLSATRLVIVVSHDREFAEQYGDRVIELADGRVIGDISKQTAAGGADLPDVSVVGDSFIRIRRGAVLTENDLKLINAYLAGKKTDTVIPIEPAAEKEVKKALRFEEGAEQASTFAETDESKIEVDTSKGKEKLIRSRLPFKNAFRMGASGLKHKRVRLAFSIILATLSFAMFGFADTAGSYSPVNAIIDTMEMQNVDYTQLMIMQGPEEESDYYYAQSMGVTQSQINGLSERYGKDFRGVAMSSFDFYELYESGVVAYELRWLKYVTEITQDLVEEMGWEWLAGGLPGENEIVLPERIYRVFEKCGYNGGGTKKEIRSPEDLVGLTVDGRRVSGIVDTRFPEKFDVLFENGDAIYSEEYRERYNEFYNSGNTGYQSCAFCGEGMVSQFANLGFNGSMYSETTSLSFWIQSAFGGFSADTALAQDWQTAENGIVLPATDVQALFPGFQPDFENIAALKAYSENWLSQENTVLLKVEAEYSPNSSGSQEISLEEREYRVVGVICNRWDSGTVYVPSATLSAWGVEQKYSSAIAPGILSERELREILSVKYSHPVNETFIDVENAVVNSVDSWDDTIRILADVLLYVGIGFAVFAALLMMNFISTSVAFKKREIGILLAIGARSKDVFSVFFWESLLITLINFALSVVLLAVAVPFVNRAMSGALGMILLHFGLRQVGLILALAVVVAFIGTFLPVYRLAKKKPIDTIRDR